MIPGRISRPGLAYSLPYRLYVPPHRDGNRSYPLLLFLHGSGARGDDNGHQVGPELAHLMTRLQAHEPVFVLAPQCPVGDKWVGGAGSAPFLNYRTEHRPESDASRLLRALLAELAQTYALDKGRLYLTGHSSGAAGSWDLLLRHPNHPFAAAVPVTGTSDPSRAALVAQLPIWIFHGAQDRTSPVSNARGMVAALRSLGSPVRYTEYPYIGHSTLGRAYDEPGLVPWLLAQRRPYPRSPRRP